VVQVRAALARLPAVRSWAARRRDTRRARQLPEALERMASGLRAGRSLGSALAEVAATCPPPLGHELRAVAAAVEHGAGVERALHTWTTAAASSRDVALAGTALELGGRAGGEVARALDRVAATLRERRELQAEVRALATQARASAGILIACPLVFTAFVSTIEPGVAGFLLTTPAGLACLLLGTVLDALGALWMARIVEDAA
jgi:tight adherence protein B